MSESIIFNDCRVFDGHGPDYRDASVFVEGGTIREVSDQPIKVNGARLIDGKGRVLMPGLIDAHVHVYAAQGASTRPPTYLAHFASHTLRRSLDWGFTTIRDMGGADVGLAQAIADAYFPSPRLFYGGRIISQTGGHGDFRRAGHDENQGCGCFSIGCGTGLMSRLVDGVDSMRHAVREELRKGATHIKLMASGGVVSPQDALENEQFSDDEIRVAIDECRRHGVYVAAHCHPANSVRRCVELGVRSIEHATLIDASTAAFVAKKDTFVVPTMAVIFALMNEPASFGLSEHSVIKLKAVAERALESIAILRQAGVRLGFGTDLLGKQQVRQCDEFALRARVETPLQILRSATSINAEILMRKGELGCIMPGARADLLLVDGNPLQSVDVLGRNGTALDVIVKDGSLHKLKV